MSANQIPVNWGKNEPEFIRFCSSQLVNTLYGPKFAPGEGCPLLIKYMLLSTVKWNQE